MCFMFPPKNLARKGLSRLAVNFTLFLDVSAKFFVHREDEIDIISSHLTLSYVILSYLPILLLHYRPLFLAKQNEGVGRLLGQDDISCRFGTGFDLDPLDVGGYRRRGERLDIDWLCLDERLVNGSGWGWGHPRPVRTGLLERNDTPMA